MSLEKWAQREVKIACKDADDYVKNCYKSAFKAFKSLLKDEHSGGSIGFTKQILNRLIDRQPLTAITDADFFIKQENEIVVPYETLQTLGLKSQIQCPRMSALFRDEGLDGKITYHDVDRTVCYDINRKEYGGWHFGLVNEIVDELFPITMPYMPDPKLIVAYCEAFLTDKSYGTFDTYAVYYFIKEGEKTEINRFYKAGEKGWEQISEQEFNERKAKKIDA